MNNHVIILGWDEFSEWVLRELRGAGIPVAVITHNSTSAIRDRYGEDEGVTIIEVDQFEALGQYAPANPEEASRFFVNLPSDNEQLLRIVDIAERDEWTG
ncbi:MAG: hypothetical protein ABEJ65_05160, partial [bacterium]